MRPRVDGLGAQISEQSSSRAQASEAERERLCAIVLGSSARRKALVALRDCGPAGAWISAGFVRNAIFSALFGPPSIDLDCDLDVTYLDPTDARRERDTEFERTLEVRQRGVWQVKNQARMALRHKHPMYRTVEEAISYFPETATAVAVRLGSGRLEVLAPYGLQDLFEGTIRATSHTTRALFEARCSEKRWRERWPALRVVR
jgi:hypothetical protein